MGDHAGMHHVVFIVRPEHQDAAADFWRTTIGIEFEEIVLEDVDLRVLLAWKDGLEVISPTSNTSEVAQRFNAHLDEHGEGVFSVVARTFDMEASLAAAQGFGAEIVMRHDRSNEQFHIDEAQLAPLMGVSVTFLETTRPG